MVLPADVGRMPIALERVETVTVDSSGTLVDPLATVEELAEHVPEELLERVATEWRARSITYTMVGNAIGHYESFYELNRHALAFAAANNGVELTHGEVDEVLSVSHELEVLPDERDGIERLRGGGPWESFPGDCPGLEADGFHDVADALGA